MSQQTLIVKLATSGHVLSNYYNYKSTINKITKFKTSEGPFDLIITSRWTMSKVPMGFPLKMAAACLPDRNSGSSIRLSSYFPCVKIGKTSRNSRFFGKSKR